MTIKTSSAAFEDIRVPVRYKLVALWSSVVFLYMYGDYFELYQPGKLQAMIAGKTGLGPVTQTSLMGMAAMMAVPSLMVILSLVLPATVNRWVNIILGTVYAAIMVLAVQGSWHFYTFYGWIEIALSLSIAWCAWTWPKQSVSLVT